MGDEEWFTFWGKAPRKTSWSLLLPETMLVSVISVAGGGHDGFHGLTCGHVDIHGPRCCVLGSMSEVCAPLEAVLMSKVHVTTPGPT